MIRPSILRKPEEESRRKAARQAVLVPGASSGIGEATARKFVEEGYVVYAVARRVERMRELEAAGATVLKMDVTDEEDIVGGVNRINEEQGGVDILINDSGP